jgi:hypothetical protein
MGSSNVMGGEEKYCIWSDISIGGCPLKDESEYKRIHSII